MKVADLVTALETIAPLARAERWDNVGLLAGDPDAPLSRALLAIDCTRGVIDEAARGRHEAIVSYHPPIFHAIKQVTRGSIAFELVSRGIAAYSPHTALDAARGGTNDVLADAVELTSRAPIRPSVDPSGDGSTGMGRIGNVAAVDRGALVARVKARLGVTHALVAGPTSGEVTRVAVCAGAAGDLLEAAIVAGAQAVIAGEVRHHDALAAAARGVTVVCVLHSNSERASLPALAERLRAALPGLGVAISAVDRDPFVIA
jgi:dinuclear metal center YbgI/SA1388 family protein